MSNTVAGRRQFDNSQECIAKKRQWRRHANENTPEQNACKGSEMAALLNSLSFVFKTLFLPKHCVKHYHYNKISRAVGYNAISVYRWILPKFWL